MAATESAVYATGIGECTNITAAVQESGEEQGLPVQGSCPGCGEVQNWMDVLSRSESVPWRQSRYSSSEALFLGKQVNDLRPTPYVLQSCASELSGC